MKRLLFLSLLFIASSLLFSQQPSKTRLGDCRVFDDKGNVLVGILFESIEDNKLKYEVYIVDRQAFYRVVKNSEYKESEAARMRNGKKNINYCSAYPDACVNDDTLDKLYFDFNFAIAFAKQR